MVRTQKPRLWLRPAHRWQGWAVLIGYLVLVIASIPLAQRSLVAHLSLLIVLTAGLLLICSKTIRGGWRWRLGEKD